MNVRIIAGTRGGRIIEAPGRGSTHAMSERGRNALFNSLGSEVEGKSVLDAFAGSGSLGLEALSRGARRAVFIEKDRIASEIIAKNIHLLQLDDEASVIRIGVALWINNSANEKFDLIFADPPYDNVQLSTVLTLFGLLKPGGCMILSHPGIGEVPVQDGIVVVDNRSYGNLHLTFFRNDA